MLFNLLNDEFVVGHNSLVPAHLPRSHSLQHAHAWSAVTVLSVDAIFENKYFTTATPLRCGGICNDVFIANFLLSVTVKEFLKNVQHSSFAG